MATQIRLGGGGGSGVGVQVIESGESLPGDPRDGGMYLDKTVDPPVLRIWEGKGDPIKEAPEPNEFSGASFSAAESLRNRQSIDREWIDSLQRDETLSVKLTETTGNTSKRQKVTGAPAAVETNVGQWTLRLNPPHTVAAVNQVRLDETGRRLWFNQHDRLGISREGLLAPLAFVANDLKLEQGSNVWTIRGLQRDTSLDNIGGSVGTNGQKFGFRFTSIAKTGTLVHGTSTVVKSENIVSTFVQIGRWGSRASFTTADGGCYIDTTAKTVRFTEQGIDAGEYKSIIELVVKSAPTNLRIVDNSSSTRSVTLYGVTHDPTLDYAVPGGVDKGFGFRYSALATATAGAPNTGGSNQVLIQYRQITLTWADLKPLVFDTIVQDRDGKILVGTTNTLPTASQTADTDISGVTWTLPSGANEGYTRLTTHILPPKEGPLGFIVEATVGSSIEASRFVPLGEQGSIILSLSGNQSIQVFGTTQADNYRYVLRGNGTTIPASTVIRVYSVEPAIEGAPGVSIKGNKGDKGDPGTDGTDGTDGTPGAGVPAGGSTGQVLAKRSATDRDTEWVNQAAGGGGGGSNVPNKPATPTTDTKYELQITSSGAASWVEAVAAAGGGGFKFTRETFTGTKALTAADFGKLIDLTGNSDGTLTMPPITANDIGKLIAVHHGASGSGTSLTVQRNGSQTFNGESADIVLVDFTRDIFFIAVSTVSWATLRFANPTRLPARPTTPSATTKYELQVTSGGVATWVTASTGGGGSPPTAGPGVTVAGTKVSADLGDGLEFSASGDAGKIQVDLDGSTLARGADGIKVASGGISTTELASGVVPDLPSKPATPATTKKYELQVAQTTGVASWVEAAAAAGGGSSLTLKGVWAASTAYVVGDIVYVGAAGQNFYLCVVAHTSTNLNRPDLSVRLASSGNWLYIDSAIQTWTSGVFYPQGAIVKRVVSGESRVYIAFTSVDTSTEAAETPETTTSNWIRLDTPIPGAKITVDSSAPSSPSEGDIWIDTTGTATIFNVRGVSAWVRVGPSVTDAVLRLDRASVEPTGIAPSRQAVAEAGALMSRRLANSAISWPGGLGDPTIRTFERDRILTLGRTSTDIADTTDNPTYESARDAVILAHDDAGDYNRNIIAHAPPSPGFDPTNVVWRMRFQYAAGRYGGYGFFAGARSDGTIPLASAANESQMARGIGFFMLTTSETWLQFDWKQFNGSTGGLNVGTHANFYRGGSALGTTSVVVNDGVVASIQRQPSGADDASVRVTWASTVSVGVESSNTVFDMWLESNGNRYKLTLNGVEICEVRYLTGHYPFERDQGTGAYRFPNRVGGYYGFQTNDDGNEVDGDFQLKILPPFGLFSRSNKLELVPDAVETAHLQDDAVTQAKIADDAVGSSQIADDAVGNDQIAANAVQQAQMADSSVGTAELRAGEVTAAKIDTTRTLAAVGDSAPTSPSPKEGDLWVDTTGSTAILKVRQGSAWVNVDSGDEITISDTAPTSPGEGQLWVDTTGSTAILKIREGSAWVAVNHNIGIPDKPANPSATTAYVLQLTSTGTASWVAAPVKATKAQAEAGEDNAAFITPLRAAEEIYELTEGDVAYKQTINLGAANRDLDVYVVGTKGCDAVRFNGPLPTFTTISSVDIDVPGYAKYLDLRLDGSSVEGAIVIGNWRMAGTSYTDAWSVFVMLDGAQPAWSINRADRANVMHINGGQIPLSGVSTGGANTGVFFSLQVDGRSNFTTWFGWQRPLLKAAEVTEIKKVFKTPFDAVKGGIGIYGFSLDFRRPNLHHLLGRDTVRFNSHLQYVNQLPATTAAAVTDVIYVDIQTGRQVTKVHNADYTEPTLTEEAFSNSKFKGAGTTPPGTGATGDWFLDTDETNTGTSLNYTGSFIRYSGGAWSVITNTDINARTDFGDTAIEFIAKADNGTVVFNSDYLIGGFANQNDLLKALEADANLVQPLYDSTKKYLWWDKSRGTTNAIRVLTAWTPAVAQAYKLIRPNQPELIGASDVTSNLGNFADTSIDMPASPSDDDRFTVIVHNKVDLKRSARAVFTGAMYKALINREINGLDESTNASISMPQGDVGAVGEVYRIGKTSANRLLLAATADANDDVRITVYRDFVADVV